jgi:L-ascorbate metabolism protein UlaG (beta-lactamase superfamily)
MRWRFSKVARSLLGLVAVLLFAGCGNSYYHGPVTAHFDGRKFVNPWAPMPESFRTFLKWRMNADPTPWPDSVPVTLSSPPQRVYGDTLRVTYVGHCTVLLQTQGVNILTDPIWSKRASPVSFGGPKRVAVPGVQFEDLPPIDVVLVSHNHYDHMDLPTLKRLVKAHNPLVLSPLGNDAILLEDIPGMRVKTLDWGESFVMNPQLRFTLEPMQHWSARGMFDRRDALWGSFVVEAPGGPIYFLADAGYAKNLSEEIVAKYGTPRFTLLPVGAYEPEWFMKYAHMTPADAVQTYLDLGKSYAMGTQYEVFAMADESYDAPRKAVSEALKVKEIDPERFLLPAVGGWFTVPPL